MYRLLFSVKCVFVFLLLSSAAHAASIRFDDMQNASAYVFDSFHGFSSDSQQSLLVGGNASFSSYTVATLNDWNALALLTQGNLSQSGGDINGLTHAGGTVVINSASALRSTDASRNFDQAYFIDLASQISQQSTGTASFKWGALQLAGSLINNTLYVDVTQAMFDQMWGVQTVDIFNGARVVLNVAGESVSMNSQKDWLMKDSDYAFNVAANNVLYNFYEATDITIGGGIYGSVLAPNADVTGNWGVLKGQLIANSFSGSTQLNDSPFNVDESTKRVSEPSASALLLVGLALLMGNRRRFRRPA